MAAEWYCYIAGREFGPLSAQDLRNMVAEGSLTPRHHVRRGTSGPWVEAGQVKGLFAASNSQQNIPSAVAVMPGEQPMATSSQSATIPESIVPQAGEPAHEAIPVAPVAQDSVPHVAPVAATVRPSKRGSAAGSGSHRAVSGVARAAAEQSPHAELSPEKLLAARRKKTNKVLFLSGVFTIGVALLIALAALFWPRGSSPSASAGGDSKPKASAADELDPLKASKPSPSPTQPAEPTTSSTAPPGKAPDDAPPAKAGAGATGTTEVKWTPVSAAVERGGLEVRIEQVGPGKPVLYSEKGSGGRRTFRNPMLVVKLALKNVSGNPSVRYKPWGYNYEGVSLKDDRGRTIMPAPIRSRGLLAEGQQDQPEVPIEQVIEDLLVFEIPREAIRHLRLFLPGTALGAAEPIGFEIPATALREFESAKRTGDEPGGSEKPIAPGRSSVGEIDRAIDEIQREKPAGDAPIRNQPGTAAKPADEDPAGDISKINRDIEELEKERGGMMNDGAMNGGKPGSGKSDDRPTGDRKMESP